MKKVYQKPEVYYESFTLMESIAGSCSVVANSGSETTCSVPVDGIGNVFIAGVTPTCDLNGEYYGVGFSNAFGS